MAMMDVHDEPGARDRVRPQRDRLRDATRGLERTLTAPAPHRVEQWANEVRAAFAEFTSAFAAHVEFAEGADGLFAELLANSVDVAPEIDRLRRDHQSIAAAVDTAREGLGSVVDLDDVERVRSSLVAIIDLVVQHRHRGADLLYQVYSVDVSVGD